MWPTLPIVPFVRNFNPFGDSLDFTSGGIYEPLVVVTAAGGGRRYNWLASNLSWSAGPEDVDGDGASRRALDRR